MAETTIIRPTTAARPYARAAFEEARDTQALPLWAELLQTAATVAANPAVNRLIGSWNPKLRGEQKVDLVADLCCDLRKGAKTPAAFVTFLKILAEFHRLDQLPSVAVLFEQLRADAESVVYAEFTSAAAVSDTQRVQVIKALKVKFQRDVELDCKTDSSLIAGAIIRVGDLVIDGSARGRLEKLAMALSQ
ncbi:MAG: F0F1 ATP synthase subunit delta [Candidatus Contendobacter odensis]|uniref:ATP synthase subunit delta n=1 Tax=Candidatus Contendibacter odensensis TaxID=1400860 RepID=A0A2G6PHJ6_9GAMM|nr:MAG: F0F1 ATP synthase subunit delta [Candidatus Contendobacter odensis]